MLNCCGIKLCWGVILVGFSSVGVEFLQCLNDGGVSFLWGLIIVVFKYCGVCVLCFNYDGGLNPVGLSPGWV